MRHKIVNIRNVEKKENKLPTEEVIKIVEKYRKLAKKDIVEQIILNDNIINMAIIKFKVDPVGAGFIFFYKFSLNGKEYLEEIKMDHSMRREEMVKEVFDILSKKIAYKIILENKTIFTKN